MKINEHDSALVKAVVGRAARAVAAGWGHSRRLLLLLAILLSNALDAHVVHANQFVRMDYNLTLASRSRNTAFIEVFDDRPLTRDNFMQYVNANLFDGTLMHRLSKNFVLQGGGYYPFFIEEPALDDVSLDSTNVVDLDGNFATDNPSVNNEFSNLPYRSNLKGTLAMAKQGGNPNSASNQWFVNLNNNAGNLDTQNGGFTVFAQVVGDGMTLFDAFGSLSVSNLNPDFDNNGTRDGGPFYNYDAPAGTDGVPLLNNTLVVLTKAARVDYYGSTGSSTTLNIPVGGYTISARDAFFDTGASITGTGSLTIAAGRSLGVREGITLNRTVINSGTLEFGVQLGTLTVQNYEQTASGTLGIDIRGTTADTNFDKLTVSNSAQLAGTLRVSLINLFSPTAGNSFTVLSTGSITGGFTNYDFPALATGLVWGVNQSATALTLSIVKADYNGNGLVDAADYTLWRDTYGKSVTAYTGADGSGDGFVNAADYGIWKSNFGKLAGSTAGSGSGAISQVPEPGMATMFFTAAGILAIGRRRRPVCRDGSSRRP